ncbi:MULTISPECIES: globin domain-containing protein [unclassified Streptomyces]|uniref:globin domain-containing protein n=1 Tax=unclassified Streptomyces TaxID=2593676 RepID=UPI0035D7BA77
MAVVEPQVDELAVYFYAILFMRYPDVRGLFPENMDIQRDRLLRALLRIVDLVDAPEHLARFCARLGRDHRKFGTEPGHYAAVGECLLETLARYAGPAWTPEIALAWQRAYGIASETMMLAANDDTRLRPATWAARIIEHRRLGNALAEITVATDPVYPYQAGQYVSMETPWRPRVWRHYSPANAPRPDSTLTFHVRHVSGGHVSHALVYRAQVGDVVRLGPPEGDMVLSSAFQGDLLCVAGGTGLAPVKALIEQIADEQPRNAERRVSLFVGARTGNELYGLNDMLRMSQRYHWLTVRAAVSHERIPGAEGSLPEVIAASGPWGGTEAFVSGPPGMIAATREALQRCGMPASAIHHDPLGVPVLDAPLDSAHVEEEQDNRA